MRHLFMTKISVTYFFIKQILLAQEVYMYISSYVFVHSSRLGNNFAGILFEHVRINMYF